MIDHDFLEKSWNEFLSSMDGQLTTLSLNGERQLTAAKLAFINGFKRGSECAFEAVETVARKDQAQC